MFSTKKRLHKSYAKHPSSKKSFKDGNMDGAVDPVKVYRFIRSEPPQSSVGSPVHGKLQNGPPVVVRTGGFPEIPLALPTNVPPLRIWVPHPVEEDE